EKSEEELETLLLTDTIKELISYAIGCIMGRYSLDQPCLIYANSGNDQFSEIYHEKHNQPTPPQTNNHSSNSCDSWSSFSPDQDGIIPNTDTDWFPDDAANRFIEFISVTWPKENLEENLKFVAESLNPKRGESPRETIRRYISTGFFKHHLKMYKKRPIYWLFSSGKLRAFQCLVYLHRYNEGTLSRMRTEYVIPLQRKIAARIEQLSGDINAATSTAHRKKLEREKDKLVKQQVELQNFDEKLRHYADQRISLDLDDGVKVNYGKFGDLLAEVKAVTGKKKKQ
ncbi:MAG: SAM-dependent methyltransferase, partial [Deltaproteobacteria bacterium]|nr:SAM-dependent methyltransferase [Deltaproteobacteria bacterium]